MQFGNRQAAQRILGVLLLVCASVTANATDAPPMIFEHLATLEGLPQGTVKAALQDSQGFVWIGTEDGLVRFDGHEIHRYAYSRTVKGSLPGNFVNALAEDTKGDLWIAIKGAGLARWQRTAWPAPTLAKPPGRPPLRPDAVGREASRARHGDGLRPGASPCGRGSARAAGY